MTDFSPDPDNSDNLDGSAPKKESMLENEYARSALMLGLKLGKKLGSNPYKFGLIGSTDTEPTSPSPSGLASN